MTFLWFLVWAASGEPNPGYGHSHWLAFLIAAVAVDLLLCHGD